MYLSKYSECIMLAVKELNGVINSFENDETVQSFFVSGHFGKENQERLIALREALIKYSESIHGDGALYPQTKQFLEDQLNRLNQ